ncbi:hypothetical protein [Actinokineospora sp.]|uniref:hypothetical protein n=1 Tax=Actinokineospora sp. TaxID=1872133 RepID=UPI0040383641
MKLTQLAGGCELEHCPAIHVSDRETLVFQGDAVHRADGLHLGNGEQAVELPIDLVREAVRVLGW